MPHIYNLNALNLMNNSHVTGGNWRSNCKENGARIYPNSGILSAYCCCGSESVLNLYICKSNGSSWTDVVVEESGSVLTCAQNDEEAMGYLPRECQAD